MSDNNTHSGLPPEDDAPVMSNFIHTLIDQDIAADVYRGHMQTRFPPEPNGYLHIGHAKAIYLDFMTAKKYGGACNLRFDDTNPVKEDVEYVDAIMEDIRWLGFEWNQLFFASDYFDQLYDYAVKLIQNGKAYVCDLSAEQIKDTRGTLTQPGQNSPYRDRSIEENLDLFARMKAGAFQNGEKVLRAKIDMASPNLNMRDPVIYRISHTHHHRTGDKWCIYPMYDYAHPMSDAIEGVTHSLCTLEFEDHRPIYDWFVREAGFPMPPRQIEFARLELTDTVMSKRKLLKLVEEGNVDGWDDPRMPTICGLRRRGYTKEAILDFCERIGVAKKKSTVDYALLEHCVREDLKSKAPRIMAVTDPVKVVITNYPADQAELMEISNNPEHPEMGTRQVLFTRELYIEREDYMEEPPKKYFRMYPDNEVRLMGAYIVKCEKGVYDDAGNLIEIHCTYDSETRSNGGNSTRKVKGTLHWVSAIHGVPIEVRTYQPIFKTYEEEGELKETFNNHSLAVKHGFAESEITRALPGDKFQFVRQGYYCIDTKDAKAGRIVLNETVALKSSYKPIA